jgi:hypothetical protein
MTAHEALARIAEIDARKAEIREYIAATRPHRDDIAYINCMDEIAKLTGERAMLRRVVRRVTRHGSGARNCTLTIQLTP